jgi:hypothetical protein
MGKESMDISCMKERIKLGLSCSMEMMKTSWEGEKSH